VDFRKQFEAIQQVTRVCWYDREGYGRSQNSDRAKGHHQIVTATQASLSAMLQNAGETGPFIIAAHSLGGAMARYYAMMAFEQVAGLFLIDASHEDMGPGPRQWTWPLAMHVLSPLGVDIWVARAVATNIGYADFDSEDLMNYANDRFWKATASESYWWWESADLVSELKTEILGNSTDPLFGDLPISVLTAGESCVTYNPPSIPVQEMEGAETTSDNTLVYVNQTHMLCHNVSGTFANNFTGWLDLQRQLACESSDFFWEVYPSNSHYLTLQQPDLVTKRLLDLLQRSRLYLAAQLPH